MQASRDLYCIELTPVPGLDQVAASFELNRIPSPFGANVTRAGAIVYAPVLRVQGLPDPDAFAAGSRVWVAWLATPLLHPTRKLGIVQNGESTLPNIDWSKFLVLVTAERSADVTEPGGRVALRGFSPSSRLQPPDMIEFLYGALPAAEKAARDTSHAAHVAHANDTTKAPSSGADRWFHPTMPRGLAMMPAEMNLAPPSATPFMPQVNAAASVPAAKPREVVRVQDGDTLVLTAGLVRQTIDGHSFIGYGYNGQVPGPIIWAQQGATIVVRYRNRIEWPTTVHWHGIRLANRYDGASGLTQAPVPPLGDFDYVVHLRDAGLYWYHPHRREDILKDLGLYGNVMVRASREEYGPAHREEVLMLDDIEMAAEGVMPFGAERATHALMGRFGNVLLVNGRRDWSMRASTGEVIRFFLTNVTNARTFNVSFGAARIKVLGSDVGNFERQEWVESIVIAPAERYIVDVRFAHAGPVALENRVVALDHTFGRFFPQVDTLGLVQVGETQATPDLAAAFDSLRQHARVVADIDRYRAHFNRPPDRQLVIRMEAENLPFVVDRFLRFDSVYFQPVEWSGTMPMMNWNTTAADVRWILEEPGTGRRNMDIRWDFRVGDVVKIRIANLRETLHGMQHPIHFHGQRFLVLGQNGVRNRNLAWKDTFLLPAGGTADILLEISNPGSWMAHCHVSEHLESGMMMTFTAR
ncbi:MAG: multicopper oxidase family protein [Longimicrobiales bacterium]